MTFDARLRFSAEPRASWPRLGGASLTAWLGVALLCCNAERAPEPAPSVSSQGGGAAPTATSTYRLEPPTSREPRAPEPQFSALAAPGDEEKVPDLATSGSPSPTCIQGWVTPPRGSALRSAALDMMRSSEDELFVVDEMRYFVGPEDAEVIAPRGQVERWYVKGYAEAEPRRRQRWLVRRARVGSGVDAVAPYDSSGYGPNTWTRLDVPDKSLADPFQHPCELSKRDAKCMGLPHQVLGCLEGT